MTVPETELVPALYEHCVEVYEQMANEAKLEVIDESGDGRLVYEGFITRLFQDLGLSIPYFSSVMTKLKAMQSVSQLRRGGSTTPSRWVLITAPTLEAFRATPDKHLASAGSWRRGMEQQLRDISKRLSDAGL